MVNVNDRVNHPPRRTSSKKLWQGIVWITFGIGLDRILLLQQDNRSYRNVGGDTISKSSSSCLTWPLEAMLTEHATSQSKHTNSPNRETRISDWATFLVQASASSKSSSSKLKGTEVGVFDGQFAQAMLLALHPSHQLESYTLVDPWRHLDDWNKPYNKGDDEFNQIYQKAMNRTIRHPKVGHYVHVIRETSLKAAAQVPDASLDFIYLDGDHTAKGAMMDLMLWTPKIKCGGLVFGDDYKDSMQHGEDFSPTMVKSAVRAYTQARGLVLHEIGSDQFAFVAP